MIRLLDDPNLPKHLSALVIAAIAYFIIPEDKDAIPEHSVTLTISFCAPLLLTG